MSNQILLMPTPELLERLHPDNPQMHSEDKDLPKIRHSLLNFGWLQYITIQKNGYILSGHGRAMSAGFLSQQDPEYFDFYWKKWLASSDEKKALAIDHQERFKASYWDQCPVIETTLDEISQKAVLIRLNDTQSDGTADPVRIAALLSQMKKPEQDLAGWEPSVAKNFIAAYALKKSQKTEEAVDNNWNNWEDEENDKEEYSEDGDDYEETEGENDFEGKEYFENPDATDYSVSGDSDSLDDVEIAKIDVSNIDDNMLALTQGFTYNPESSEQTRILFYYDKPVLPEIKKLINLAAEKLGIPREGDLKRWRSQAVFLAIESFVGDFLSQDIDNEDTDQEEDFEE